MGISLIVSILILAVAAVIGLQDRKRLSSSRERNARAVSQAEALGISSAVSDNNESVLVTKRNRETGDEAAKREAAELLALMKKADAGGDLDESAAGKLSLERLLSLDPVVAGFLVRDVLADKELAPETREGVLGVMLSKLSHDSPQAVLQLLPDLGGAFRNEEENGRMMDHLLSTSLGNWAKKEPLAVSKWIRENGSKYPGSINDSIKGAILSSAAAADPSLALGLIDEMGIGEKKEAVILIARAAGNSDAGTSMLAALRTYFAKSPDKDPEGGMMRAAVGELVLRNFSLGFGPATKWLETAKLEPSEMAVVGTAIVYSHTQNETGQWLDWLGHHLPADQAGKPIGRIMAKWTELDYQSAGKWLAAAPEGLAKSASVQAYAAAVSRYEPLTAVQWAMTLPAGKDRDATLRKIHENWPKDQVSTRDAFAKEHGIE